MKPTAARYKRRFGDRPDGRRLRSVDPLFAVATYIMKKRSGSSNLFSGSINITEAEKYIRTKRRENMPGLGILHFFIAAYVRTLSQKPALNRFVAGQKLYARHDIVVNLTVKKEMTVEGQETTVKIHFEPTDTISIVYRKVQAAIDEAKGAGDSNNTDKAARLFHYIPGLFLKFVVRLFEIMDYFGVLPRARLEISPFHGSIFISDLGSVGLPPVNHHLYDFGTIPIFLAFGIKNRGKAEGKQLLHRYVNYTLTMDDRICDGYYYSRVLKILNKIFKNPQILENPPEKVAEDIE